MTKAKLNAAFIEKVKTLSIKVVKQTLAQTPPTCHCGAPMKLLGVAKITLQRAPAPHKAQAETSFAA